MTELVRDTFTRTVAAGSWGTADVGGAWATSVSSGVLALSVNGSLGRADWTTGTGGSGFGYMGSAQPALEAHGCITVRPTDATMVGSVYWMARAAGPVATFAGYGIRIGRNGGTQLIAELVRGPIDAPTVLATLTPAGVWSAVTTYWRAELELLGANPTTIRGRWFALGSEPTDDAGWTTVTDSAGPQAAGVFGMRAQRTGGVVGALNIDNAYMADPLRPSFTYTVDPDGLTARFVSSSLTSGDPVAHAWTFGDGGDEVIPDPGHLYAAPGSYSVTYTAWTRWGTRRSVTQTVVIPGPVAVEVPDVKPAIFVNGEDVCDRVFAAQWRTGRDRWPDETNGASITLQLRGRLTDVVAGAPVVVQLPAGAPAGTLPLFRGEIDSIIESIDPIEAKTVTTIVAQDVMAFLSRWHILPASSFVEGGLPTRLLGLAPRASTVYRAKWAGVPGARWPTLKSLAMSADKLRTRTYLDLLRDGLRASIATAYVAPDGAIVYAPLDPPAGVAGTVPILDLDISGPDCADHDDVERSTAEGLVNRWTAGDGSAVDRVERPSIEAYGESSWSVGTGVLKSDSTFPVTDPIAAALREPFPARSVTIPVRSWAGKAYLAQPLDMAAMGGVLYGILGVSHTVTVDDWRVELKLDRDPWSITGGAPPTPPAVHTTTQTFSCDADALLASPNSGAGKSTRLPVGYWSGTKFRALVRFDLDWAHPPKRIVLGELLLDTANQDAVGYGGNPGIQIDRVTGSWSEGGAGGDGPPWTYSQQNAVVYPGPSITSTGRKTTSVSSGTNVAVTQPITQIVQAWADGSANRGIRIISTDETSSSKTTEFYSSEYGGTSTRRPQLRVTYEW